MREIVDIVLASDARREDFEAVPIPELYTGVAVREKDVNMFEGMRPEDKDPRKSLHLVDVPTPLPGPGEALIAVMASSRVVAHCLSVELERAEGHDDTMLDPEQRIWGYETNYGGLAQLALVKSNQVMPKPAHLTWEEAAAPGLVNSTAYRQLVSRNGPCPHTVSRHGAG